MRKVLRIILIFICFLCLLGSNLQAQGCQGKRRSFTFGEKVDYMIYYYLAGIWVSAGEVYFKVDSARIKDQLYYHFNSYGTTLKRYDWFYKVRDEYEAYTHVESFRPLRFKRSVNEGSTYIREDYLFNQKKKEVYTLRKLGEDLPIVKDTVPSDNCSLDPISTIYYARNIDFSNAKIDEEIPLKIFLDNMVYDSYVRYLGKENLKIKGLGI